MIKWHSDIAGVFCQVIFTHCTINDDAGCSKYRAVWRWGNMVPLASLFHTSFSQGDPLKNVKFPDSLQHSAC